MKTIFVFLVTLNLGLNLKAQVNFQTGSAEYELPVFDWKDNYGFLNSKVALTYSSGNGLKVNDLASNIGQGWNVLAGGSITRIQVGEPDDQKPYKYTTPESYLDTKKYPAGYLYSDINPALGVSSSINQYPIFSSRNVLYKQHNDVAADKELDIFSFQFNGKGGRFILDKYTNQGVCLENKRIKIWFDRNENNASANNIRTTIIAFYLQDESGTIYKFSKYLKAKVLKPKYCNGNDLTTTLQQPNFKNGRVYHQSSFDDPDIMHPYIINEWQLTEIEDGFTHRKIYYNYNATVPITISSGTSIATYDETKFGGFGGTLPKIYSIISHQISKTEISDLATITYPDGHEVSFQYGQSRVDIPGAATMSSIDVKYQGRFISRHELQTGYFINNRIGVPLDDEKPLARLCLRSVKRIGPDLKMDDNPYEFEYYRGSSAPGDIIPPQFTHLKDVWGYYNGDQSADFNNVSIPLDKKLSELNASQVYGLCFRRNGQSTIKLNPKTGYAKNGLLKQIIYPTGGSINFDYEQNEAVLPGGSVNTVVGGVHVSKTTVTDGGYSNGCGPNALVTNYSFKLASSNLSSLYALESPNNKMVTSSYYQKAGKRFRLLALKCKYKYQYPGILSREQVVDLKPLQKLLESGILDFVGTAGTALDIVLLCLHNSPALIFAVVMDVINIVAGIITSCSNKSKTNPAIIYTNNDLNAGNPLPSAFKRVEIINGDGSSGKTVMEFTSPDYYPIWAATNPTYSMKQRYATWAYGLPLTTTVFDANGYPIKRTETSYTFPRYKYKSTSNTCTQSESELLSCKYLIHVSASKRSDDWVKPANYNFPTYSTASNNTRTVDMYGVIVGNAIVSQKIEKVFKKNSSTEFLSTTTNYTYNNTYTVLGMTGDMTSQRDYIPLVESVKTINSDGTVSAKTFGYTHYLDKMVLLPNKETTSKAANISAPFNNLKIVETEYTTLVNGDLRPTRIKEARYSVPGGTILPFVDKKTFTYDANGLLISSKDEGGRTVSNIYDYDNRFVVATIVNAVPAIDKPSYTSFETSSLGGWTLGGGSATYGTSAITGTRSLALFGKTLTANLNIAKANVLSFWSTGSLSVSSGATLNKSAPTINGLTYYEYLIASGTSSVTISGYAYIDEVRLCPQSARISTVTYDPVIGKTSETDINGRTTYYEYDELGRMRFVKDDYKNVLKMYEYNTSKKSPCPVTYTNFTVSTIITRKNCGPGYIGGSYTYTIPAGTYTSTVSQAVVDQMVDEAIAANAQIAANTYGPCYPIYSNIAMSAAFEKDDCPVGFEPVPITYTVNAGKYTSIISQADANEQAQDDIDANGQDYANTNGSCVTDYDPQWESTGLEGCANGHKTVQYMDINPNSPSYGQTMWEETDEPMACDPNACVDYLLSIEPGTTTDNLYIQYHECWNDVIKTLHWDTQVSVDEEFQTHICAQGVILFRYGTTGPFVESVPGITVENIGECYGRSGKSNKVLRPNNSVSVKN